MHKFFGRVGLLFAIACGLCALTMSGPSRAQDGHKFKVVVLIGSVANEGSFNQVSIVALKRLAAEGKIEYEVRDRVADPTASEPVIRLYASRGYNLIIGHGIDISASILKVAKDFPNIHLTASAGPDLAGRLLPNVDGWTYDFGQYGYIGGWLAGKIQGVAAYGAVGGPQLPFILATHRGFKLGLASTNPNAKVIEEYAGSFDDAQKALEATRSVAAQGATLIWTEGDGISNGVAAGANQLGLRTIGVYGEAGGMRARSISPASFSICIRCTACGSTRSTKERSGIISWSSSSPTAAWFWRQSTQSVRASRPISRSKRTSWSRI